MKFKLFFASIVLITTGCKSHVLKNNIEGIIADNKADTFSISLEKLIDKKWDSLYQFHEYTSCIVFSKIFTSDCDMPAVPDASRRYVFAKEGKVIYWEDVKHSNGPQFYISNDSSKNNFVVARSKNILMAEKVSDDLGTVFYSIHPRYH